MKLFKTYTTTYEKERDEIRMKKQDNSINKNTEIDTDKKEKNNLKIHNNLWYFIIFSLLGLIFEFILYLIMNKTVGARGVYLGPLCFIYGITALIMIRFLEPLKNTKVRLFIASTVLISIIQYSQNDALLHKLPQRPKDTDKFHHWMPLFSLSVRFKITPFTTYHYSDKTLHEPAGQKQAIVRQPVSEK